ncbi:MAG: methylmalonyl Co-A mutase-associated GTPase MeaB [Vicingus serpentipes]|nr:methylmalonyl Co-A mutase-associated GTPase MeaB [Vicingus serpentipes]
MSKHIHKVHLKSRTIHPAAYYFEGIKSGNRTILSEAITLVESTNIEHEKVAEDIIELCLPLSGNSIRIGVTGIPGVGKSTFIEAFGLSLVEEQQKKVAVLAIDPSSEKSKGSILGDKTRMTQLSSHQNAFIRPSPSAGKLGGVAEATRETILLCEAAGYDVILIETVGVGQSEITVKSMVDFFLLLMIAGAGDELQGIKRGIMEMADAILINKADGDNVKKAELAQQEYKNALHLFPPNKNGWIPQVATCSALNKENIDVLHEIIDQFVRLTNSNNSFKENRKKQAKFWFDETISNAIKNLFYNDPKIKGELISLERTVIEGEISPFKAAKKLINLFKN